MTDKKSRKKYNTRLPALNLPDNLGDEIRELCEANMPEKTTGKLAKFMRGIYKVFKNHPELIPEVVKEALK